jgi:murein DD-endopeptidase MepM/ murein hydrolase activator NlpD
MSRITLLLVGVMSLFSFAACQSSDDSQQALSVTVPVDIVTMVTNGPPTNLPSRTPTSTSTLTPSNTPTSTPTLTLTPTITFTPTDTSTPTLSPTPEPFVDHYVLQRPISSQGEDELDRSYPYGDNQKTMSETHHGVEFFNPRGTPVLAAEEGIVIYAGDDSVTTFGPKNNYYGLLVIIEHDIQTPDNLTVFTVYAHLDRIDVETNQLIEVGDRLGIVGDTGIAIGPHLHFEVRAGDPYDYDATRNPDLWVSPFFNTGTLAGRVTNREGELITNVPVTLRRAGAIHTNLKYYAWTYADDSVNSSVSWNENFTRGDLRPGDYDVFINTHYGRTLFEGLITIEAGKTSWIEIEIEDGNQFYPPIER